MTTTTERKPAELLDDAPIRARKWKNLVFAKDGSSMYAEHEFKCEADAKEYGDAEMQSIANCANCQAGYCLVSWVNNRLLPTREISHFIPMPIDPT